jgi:hypothetical protein
MKRKSKLRLVAVLFALFFSTIALLEIFRLHPQLSIGSVHACWTGNTWTEFGWGSVPLQFPDGKIGIQKDYELGPLSIAWVRVYAK